MGSLALRQGFPSGAFLAAPPLYAVSLTPRSKPNLAPTIQPRPNPNLANTIHRHAPNPTSSTQSTASSQTNPRRHNPQPRAKPNLADTTHSSPPIFFPTQKNGSAAPPQPWQPDKIKPRSRLQKYAESDSFKLSPLSYRRNSRNPDYTNSIIAVSAPSPRRAPRR